MAPRRRLAQLALDEMLAQPYPSPGLTPSQRVVERDELSGISRVDDSPSAALHRIRLVCRMIMSRLDNTYQIFYRDLQGHHGTLDGVRSGDLASTVLRRIAAKLGLSAVAASKVSLFKAGKLLASDAACGLSAGDTVHLVGKLNGGAPTLRRRQVGSCLLYTSPSPRDRLLSRMPSSA